MKITQQNQSWFTIYINLYHHISKTVFNNTTAKTGWICAHHTLGFILRALCMWTSLMLTATLWGKDYRRSQFTRGIGTQTKETVQSHAVAEPGFKPGRLPLEMKFGDVSNNFKCTQAVSFSLLPLGEHWKVHWVPKYNKAKGESRKV